MIVVKLGLRRDTKNVRSVTKHKKNGQYYHLVTVSVYQRNTIFTVYLKKTLVIKVFMQA
jgi:hypothetical protein